MLVSKGNVVYNVLFFSFFFYSQIKRENVQSENAEAKTRNMIEKFSTLFKKKKKQTKKLLKMNMVRRNVC